MNLCRSSAAVFLYLLVSLSVRAADSADQLLEGGHWKRLRALAQQQLRVNPNDARANYMLSKVSVSFGNIDDAVSFAEKSVEIDPSRAEYHAQAAEVFALMAQHSSLVKQVIHLHKMKRELEAALASDPTNLDALLVKTMFYWKAPAVAGGDRRKALEIVEELKASHPVWGWLVEAKLMQDQDQKRTQSALERASAIDPPSYLAQVSLAQFYVKSGSRAADAERLAKSAISLDPGRSAAYSVLARLYAAQSRYAELDQVLHAAEQHAPDDLSPYFYAAQTLVARGGDSERAEQFTRKYLSEIPEGRAPGVDEARQLLASIPRVHA